MPARTIGLILPDTLQLEGFSGSLWRGQAARSRVVLGDRAFHLGHLSWGLAPHTLLLLSPTFDLHTRWGAQTVDLRLKLTPSTVTLSEVDTKLDIRFVRQLIPLYTGGLLVVDLDYLAQQGSILTEVPHCGSVLRETMSTPSPASIWTGHLSM